MTTITTNNSYSYQPERKLVWTQCQSCGKSVQIIIPFIGCVYCDDCSESNNSISIGSEEFNWGIEW